MRGAALLVLLALLGGCGRIGFDVPGGTSGDDGGPGTGDGGKSDGPAGSITIIGTNGSNSAANPTTTLPGVKAGDLVLLAVGYSGPMATISAMDTDGDLATQVVSQTSANQIHFAMYSVIIGADHATETFGVITSPMANETSIAVALYRNPGAIQGQTSGESTGSSTAQCTLFGAAGSLAVVGLATGAAVTSQPAGFTGTAIIPGTLVRELDLGHVNVATTGFFSVSLPLASPTNWAMGAIAISP